MDRVDWVVAVRGASLGFTILVISGLLQPIVARYSEVIGLVWLVLGTLVASVASSWRAGPADSPVLTGVFASLFGYTLSIPLIYVSERRIVWPDVAMFAAMAVVVGAIVGYLVGRRHVPDTKPPHGRRRGSSG
jgi:hypothetical protein